MAPPAGKTLFNADDNWLVKTVGHHFGQRYLLKELVETDQLNLVIDRQYTFNDLPKALHYLETGHAKGKVIITLELKNETR